jgi:hypothetical protein
VIWLDIFCYSNIYFGKIYQILIEKEVVKKGFEMGRVRDREKSILKRKEKEESSERMFDFYYCRNYFIGLLI